MALLLQNVHTDITFSPCFNFMTLSYCVWDWWLYAGQIDAAEIQHSLHTIGVDISLKDATRILQRSANSMLISDIPSHHKVKRYTWPGC